MPKSRPGSRRGSIQGMAIPNPALPAVLRPKLRPTLSRKVKYWGIAPSAQKKLGKEARRGSHDLRRLVGHANFLDELIEEFRIDDEAEDPRRLQKAILEKQKQEAKAKESSRLREPVEIQYDDDEDTASDSWSEYDSDDDDDHALVRTESGRLRTVEEDDSSDDEEIYGIMPALTKSGQSSSESSPDTIVEGNIDYFNHRVPVSTLPGDQTDKKSGAVHVEIASPASVR